MIRRWRARRAIDRISRQIERHWDDGVQEIPCWECHHGMRCHVYSGLRAKLTFAEMDARR